MIELLKLCTNNGQAGLVLVGTKGPLMQADAVVPGEARHAGRTGSGKQVYIVAHDEAEPGGKWLVVIVGTVECIEGAVIIAKEECESSNTANLVALRSEALICVSGYAKRKGYRLYLNGTEKECGDSEAVLVGLGIRSESEELLETPIAPPPSVKFRERLVKAGYNDNPDAD